MFRIILSLIAIHKDLYIKSNKYIFPLVAWLTVLAALYAYRPQDVVSVSLSTSVFLYVILLWLCNAYYETEHPVNAQLLILKSGNRTFYYWSRILFQIAVSVIFCLIGLAFMCGCAATNGFTRKLHILDLIGTFSVYFLASVLAVAVASLMQPHIFPSRKLGFAAMTAISVLAIGKEWILGKYPFLHAASLIFPPLQEAKALFSGGDVFHISGLLDIWAYGLIYSLIFVLIAQHFYAKPR